jgi:protein subunit release factor A
MFQKITPHAVWGPLVWKRGSSLQGCSSLWVQKRHLIAVNVFKIVKHHIHEKRSNKGTNTMLDRLQIVKQRFDEISDLIIQPDVISDQKRYVQLNQEYKGLKALAEKRDEYVLLMANIDEANEIIADGSDAEMVEMAKMQLDEAKGRLPELEEEIKFMLIPKDPEDAKNVMVEVRAGTGGDEASIFAGDLFRMYTKYCEGRGWRTSVVDRIIEDCIVITKNSVYAIHDLALLRDNKLKELGL